MERLPDTGKGEVEREEIELDAEQCDGYRRQNPSPRSCGRHGHIRRDLAIAVMVLPGSPVMTPCRIESLGHRAQHRLVAERVRALHRHLEVARVGARGPRFKPSLM